MSLPPVQFGAMYVLGASASNELSGVSRRALGHPERLQGTDWLREKTGDPQITLKGYYEGRWGYFTLFDQESVVLTNTETPDWALHQTIRDDYVSLGMALRETPEKIAFDMLEEARETGHTVTEI